MLVVLCHRSGAVRHAHSSPWSDSSRKVCAVAGLLLQVLIVAPTALQIPGIHTDYPKWVVLVRGPVVRAGSDGCVAGPAASSAGTCYRSRECAYASDLDPSRKDLPSVASTLHSTMSGPKLSARPAAGRNSSPRPRRSSWAGGATEGLPESRSGRPLLRALSGVRGGSRRRLRPVPAWAIVRRRRSEIRLCGAGKCLYVASCATQRPYGRAGWWINGWWFAVSTSGPVEAVSAPHRHSARLRGRLRPLRVQGGRRAESRDVLGRRPAPEHENGPHRCDELIAQSPRLAVTVPRDRRRRTPVGPEARPATHCWLRSVVVAGGDCVHQSVVNPNQWTYSGDIEEMASCGTQRPDQPGQTRTGCKGEHRRK